MRRRRDPRSGAHSRGPLRGRARGDPPPTTSPLSPFGRGPSAPASRRRRSRTCLARLREPGGRGQPQRRPIRRAARRAADSVGGVTVNRLCASGLAAVVGACHAVVAGDGDLFVAGGVESMSRAPLVTAKPDAAFPRGDRTLYDTTLGWRFPNPRYAGGSRPRRWERRERTSPDAGRCPARTRTRSRSRRSSAGPRRAPTVGSRTSSSRRATSSATSIPAPTRASRSSGRSSRRSHRTAR